MSQMSFTLVTLLVAAASLQGETTVWQGAPGVPGDWFTDANWTGGVPAVDTIAHISNNGYADLGAGSAAADWVWIGDVAGQTGEVYRHTDGTLSCTGMTVGSAGGSGRFIGYGTSARVSTVGTLIVGDSGGTGYVLQSGEETTVGTVRLGVNGGAGEMEVASGLTVTGDVIVGATGTGTLSYKSSEGRFNAYGTVRFEQGARLQSYGDVNHSGRIYFHGGRFQLHTTDSAAMADMDKLWLVYHPDPAGAGKLEVGSLDLGALPDEPDGDFFLNRLSIDGHVQLIDEFDSHPGLAGTEALYVDRLDFWPGGTIDTNGINLYHSTGGKPMLKFFQGDSNLDGNVDVKDLAIVANGYGNTVYDWSQGDFTGDRFVDVHDLAILANNYGSQTIFVSPLGESPVPEPTTLALLLIGAAWQWRRRPVA